MRIAKVVKRWLLVIPGCLLLSAVTWGQSWAPRAAVRIQFGAAPVRFVQVDRRWVDPRWDDRRWDRDREWRQHERREREWHERQHRNEWHRHHRREEWREHYRGY